MLKGVKKKLSWFAFVSLAVMISFVILVAGCQGSPGPAGPEGAQGPAGPAGPSGVVEEPVEPEEVAPVAVDAGEDQSAEPEASLTLRADVKVNDGSQIETYKWTQESGVRATLSGADTATLQVTLPDASGYKEGLIEILEPEDRNGVQAINPHALEEAEVAVFEVTVTTSSGSYSATVEIATHLPYVWSSGINNVPVGLPVLLHGKAQGFYNWELASPEDSEAVLDDTSTQNLSFTPDVAGEYILTETSSGGTIEVVAGTWAGAISGIGSDGLPLSEGCTVCHDGTTAPDQFADWKVSGHAEIFSTQINTSTHYSESCFDCHTVGFNKDVDNGGVDDASDYADFIAEDLFHQTPNPNGWSTVVNDFPSTAALTNIQCENCHGPNNSALHLNGINDDARISISAAVCGACHGEPPRHGRFQQWEESLHAALETPEFSVYDRYDNASCARCHVGQGFIEWLPQLEAGDSGNLQAEITWTTDNVEAITCAVCHDSHNVGTVSGEPNDANLRVMGDTAMLPSGFQANGVGNGALCMTCHNTRNGERNDVATAIQDDRAPHVAAQADVLMGENAYFVTTGARSPHSYIENTCTTCHMEMSPPPAEFSYNLGGTNHSFEASLEICGDCHGAYDGGTLMEATHSGMEELKEAIEAAIIAEITALTDAGKTVTLIEVGEGDADVKITRTSTVDAVELTESHGRQSMDITVDGTTYEHINLARGTAVGSDTLISSVNGQKIAKAGWNYFLLHGDASEGIHNPTFTRDVINASLAALK